MSLEFLSRTVIVRRARAEISHQPVRDVGVLLGESHDDVAEVGQGLVDVLCLGQPHTLAPTLLHSLAAGKIHLET